MATDKHVALVVLGVQLLSLIVYATNHRFYSTNYPVNGYKVGHKYPYRFKQYHGYEYFPKSNYEQPKINQNLKSNHELAIGTPKHNRDSKNSAERKRLFYNERKNKQTLGTQYLTRETNFENFVTPKVKQFPRVYEVTTEKIKEEERFLLSSKDSDLTIAIDDEEDVNEKQKVLPVGGHQHREHQNPLVYVDSYGKVHGGAVTKDQGQGFQYGVVHKHTPSASNYHYTQYKKPTGRVRMQVYRGPTRSLGHKKTYAAWGYYVVQPAASEHHDY